MCVTCAYLEEQRTPNPLRRARPPAVQSAGRARPSKTFALRILLLAAVIGPACVAGHLRSRRREAAACAAFRPTPQAPDRPPRSA